MKIVREHFNADGSPKRSWPTEAQAQRAAEAYGKRYYRCETCGEWHVGGRGASLPLLPSVVAEMEAEREARRLRHKRQRRALRPGRQHGRPRGRRAA